MVEARQNGRAEGKTRLHRGDLLADEGSLSALDDFDACNRGECEGHEGSVNATNAGVLKLSFATRAFKASWWQATMVSAASPSSLPGSRPCLEQIADSGQEYGQGP